MMHCGNVHIKGVMDRKKTLKYFRFTVDYFFGKVINDKKFWKELISYFSLTRYGPHIK